MSKNNFEEMIQLAEDVFAVKNDPSQLDVNEDVIARLMQLHSATVSEKEDEDGPVAWILLIPTTLELMNQFLQYEISEKELFEMTPMHGEYEAIYLCSALVLERYRRQGVAQTLAINAIEKIKKSHPIKALFVWAFSFEGARRSKAIAQEVAMPLFERIQSK